MKFDMTDSWEPARDQFLAKLASGAWRHGIKTEEIMKELIRNGRFPSDLNDPLPKRWQRKYGPMTMYGLSYYAQRAGKDVYHTVIGASGEPYRVRRFYCVPHGAVEGEVDKNGKQKPGSKTGLWLRFEDLTPADVRWLVKRYGARETDSEPQKKYLWTARAQCQGRPENITMADIMDDILEAL